MKKNSICALLITLLFSSTTSASLVNSNALPDTSNDELLALSLSNMVLLDSDSEMPNAVQESYKAYDTAVYTKVKYDMNVHQFNAVTGLKVRLPLLIAHDEFSNGGGSFEETRTLLEESDDYAVFNKKNTLKLNLNRLRTHLTTSKIEAIETGTNVEVLFSRVWSLAAINPNFTQQLFLSLCENSETGGGCYPGHAGRLARLYVNFLRSQWPRKDL